MGNSDWKGPPLSALLLNMKSWDIGQGPALKSTVLQQWSGGAPLLPEFSYALQQKALVLCPGQCFF